MLKSYEEISPSLAAELDTKIDLNHLQLTTKEQISYGIIASIKALIEKHSEGKTLYFTGGDGKLLAGYFENAIYDEMLVFTGLREALKDDELC